MSSSLTRPPLTRSPLEWARRELTLHTHRIRSLPILVLMPHSRCNCRCVMCDIWKANANRQELGEEEITRHVDALRDLRLRWVVLSGGEALMHSNLWALCKLLKEELGVRITLLSTGLLLRRHAENVVKWCDEVIVSLDGSREVHNEIRRIPRAFEKLQDGVAALREAHVGYRVTGRSVIQRSNFRDLPHILDAAREIGLDQISFLGADVSSEAFNHADGWQGEEGDEGTGVALDRQEALEFKELLESTLRDHAADFIGGKDSSNGKNGDGQDSFVAESPDKMRRIASYYLALSGQGEFPKVECNAPWVSTVVEADGTVRPCFFHRELGNVRGGDLGQILNSPEAIAFRRDLDVASDPICQKCVCSLNLSPREDFGA